MTWFNLHETTVGEATVVCLEGYLCGYEGRILKEAVEKILSKGISKLFIDCSGLMHVDSGGIGGMVRAYTVSRQHMASLEWCGITDKLNALLHITKLYTVLTVYKGLLGQGEDLPDLCYVCPTPGCEGHLRVTSKVVRPSKNGESQCERCGLIVSLARLILLAETEEAEIASIKRRIYNNNEELVEAWCDYPYGISISGRLIAPVCEDLIKIWDMLPHPRYAVIDLTKITEVSKCGQEWLLSVCRHGERNVRAALYGDSERFKKLLPGVTIYADSWEAYEALEPYDYRRFWPIPLLRMPP